MNEKKKQAVFYIVVKDDGEEKQYHHCDILIDGDLVYVWPEEGYTLSHFAYGTKEVVRIHFREREGPSTDVSGEGTYQDAPDLGKAVEGTETAPGPQPDVVCPECDTTMVPALYCSDCHARGVENDDHFVFREVEGRMRFLCATCERDFTDHIVSERNEGGPEPAPEPYGGK